MRYPESSRSHACGLCRSRYGDAFVNVDGEWGVGIDGCTITKVAVRDAMISLDVRDDVHVPRTLTTRFTGVSKPEYTLRVNGKVIGTYASRELGKGIDVAIWTPAWGRCLCAVGCITELFAAVHV